MAYSYKKNAQGNYEIFQDGQRISTGSVSSLARYGLSETSSTPAPMPGSLAAIQASSSAPSIAYGAVNTTPQFGVRPVGFDNYTFFDETGRGRVTGSKESVENFARNYSVPSPIVPTTITGINSKSAPATTLPTPTPNITNFAGMTASGNAIIGANTPAITPPPVDTKNTSTTSTYDTFKNYLSSLVKPSSASDSYNTLYGQSGIEQKQADFNAKQQAVLNAQAKFQGINAQLAGFSAEAQVIPLKMEAGAENKGITTELLNRQTQQELRNNALRAIPIQVQALVAQAEVAAAQGNAQLSQSILEQAQSHLDKVFQIHQTDATNDYNFRVKQLDAIYNYADKQEQRQIEAKKTELATNQSNLADVRNFAQQLSATATANGDGNTASQLVSLTPPDINSKTFAADLQKYNVKLAEIQRTLKIIPKVTSTIPTGSTGIVSSVTQAIIDNPSLFDDLTPTLKGSVIKDLQANGYDTSNLGVKGLSNTAIKEVAQTQKALSDLAELKATIEGKSQMLGPITGLARFNPYSEARKLQADVDRVRQTVGKALEGGVLRKEDEEKYKKILATLADTPSTAIYKIDALISSISRDIENYKSLQQPSGKSLNVGASLQKKGSVKKLTDYQKLY